MRAHRDAGASTRAPLIAVATAGSELLESACGPGLAVAVDDEDAFPVHLVVPVDLTLQRDAGHGRRIRQRSKLPTAFRGECGGSPVRETQPQGHCERRDRQQREEDEYKANPQPHFRCPAENRSRAPS